MRPASEPCSVLRLNSGHTDFQLTMSIWYIAFLTNKKPWGMSMSTQIRVGHERSFNLTMAVLISAIVFYGFGHTIDRRVIHPAIPPPSLLYVHIVLSTAW